MHLKKTKDEIAYNAGQAAKSAMQTLYTVGWNHQSNSYMGQLLEIISKAVEGGVRSALSEMYTDDEFERDLTLK